MITSNKTTLIIVMLLCIGSVAAESVYITYQKQDYTGAWGGSYLHVKENISGGWYDDINETWDAQGHVLGVMTVDYLYKIVVTKDSESFDKGTIKFYDNGTLPIQLTKPIIVYGSSPIEGLTLSLWQNKTANKIYCFYNVTDDLEFTSATFNIYNATIIPPVLLYSAEDTEDTSATFQYTITNESMVYKAECIAVVNSTAYSKVQTYKFGNATSIFMQPTFERDYLGYSTVDVFRGVGLFLVVFIMGFSSMVNASILTLFGVGVIWLFYYWGWIEIDPIILGFILILAVAYRFRQSKEGKG